jgi:hypothetical protein
MAKQRLFTNSQPIDLGSLFVASHDEDVAKVAETVMGPINEALGTVRLVMAHEGYKPGDMSLVVTFDCKGEKA